MAYAVLLSLSQTIHQILNPHDHQFPISDLRKQQIESLHKQVIFLQEFVEMFPKEAKSLETGITTAANEAEDILEHFMYEHIRWHHKSVRLAEVRKTRFQPTTDLYDLRELEIATDEIDSLAREAAEVKSRITTDKVPHCDISAAELPTLDHTLLDEASVGLDEDLKKVTDLVCKGSLHREIIPIIGKSRFRKTALARNAYNHTLVKELFRVRAWVIVPYDYKINIIFAHLLESLKDVVDPKIYGTNDAAEDKIYGILRGRKYLIVLDDLWNINAWDDMKRIFPQGRHGSRVVITTREDDVASRTGSSASPHVMQVLKPQLKEIGAGKKMAYAVLLSLSQTIHQILNPDHQFPISDLGKQQIESLHKQVIFLERFVENHPDEAKSLETGITAAANEAEDILEHFMYEHIRWHHNSIMNILYDFRELKWTMDEIDSLAREAAEVKSRIRTDKVPLSYTSTAEPPTLDHTLLDEVPVGLDEDLMKITDLVCEGSRDREIIRIAGMGGIGKTTLARYAYNHALVKQKFHIRAWVTVSHDYNIDNIFAQLLASLKEVDPQIYGTNYAAQYKIYRILSMRKYLIVLDDLWSINAWNDIKIIFPQGSNGSRVVITTRLMNLAFYVSISKSVHVMGFLDENQSWILLEGKVFPNKKCPPYLKKIGMDIAKRCGGLPLAIVTVARILSNVSETRWEEFAENVRSTLQKDEQFDKIMSLSYIHLPHHLRACFLHMGGFPEDYEIHVSKFIKLWVAEGFVGPRDGRSLEEVAEEYLEDIVNESLALVTKRRSNGRIKICNVHNLIGDMSRTKAQDENLERRLSIAHPDLRCVAKVYGSTLRSVACFEPSDTALKTLRKLQLLRVLDVVDADVYSLPDQVFDLFHLRYLAFGCPMEVPTAISRLQNLRTLIIRPSKRFRKYSMDEIYLPLEIWRLPLLTVLVSFFDVLPNPEGAASAPLRMLHILSVVKKLICTEELMKMIPNIKKLGITYFGDKYNEDYQLQNLVLLQYLEKVKLVMRADSPVQREIKMGFPAMLRKLTLSGAWRRSWKTLEILSDLPNLQVLKLRDRACEGDKWVTIENQFPSLEFLLIDTSDIKVWDTEKSHFPMLKRLVIYRCSWLNEIPGSIGEISALRLIVVYHSNESLVECVKGILEEQQVDYGNETLRVDAVHHKDSQSANQGS